MPTFPQVNLNGTSQPALVQQYQRAYDKLREAIDAFADAHPHGRDYQTLPDGSYDAAAHEFREHLLALDKAQAYVEAIVMHLLETP